MITAIEQEVKDYDQAIKTGDFPDPSGECIKCGGKPEKYKFHDQKKRTFLLVVEVWVKKIVTILLRWKCPLCKKTFVHYPKFAFPYKRYVKENVVNLSEKYLKEADTSYEKCASADKSCIEYEDGSGKIFEKSTVHRWLGSLGKLSKGVKAIHQAIREKSPTSSIFRELAPILKHKYRSEKRKDELEICQKLLKAKIEFKAIFSISIFPQFATRNWRE